MNNHPKRDELIIDLALLDRGVVIPRRARWDSLRTEKRIVDFVRENLATLPENDRRVSRRKFRKLVRRAEKSLKSMKGPAGKHSSWRIDKMNMFTNQPTGKRHLTKSAIEARNLEVWIHFSRMLSEGKL